MLMRILSTFACAFSVLGAGCSRAIEAEPPATSIPPMTPASGPPSRPAQPDIFRPGCRDQFALFDEDNDGFVSPGEFGARANIDPNAAAVFRSRDLNADGMLTEDEFCSGWRAGRAVPHGARAPATQPTRDLRAAAKMPRGEPQTSR